MLKNFGSRIMAPFQRVLRPVSDEKKTDCDIFTPQPAPQNPFRDDSKPEPDKNRFAIQRSRDGNNRSTSSNPFRAQPQPLNPFNIKNEEDRHASPMKVNPFEIFPLESSDTFPELEILHLDPDDEQTTSMLPNRKLQRLPNNTKNLPVKEDIPLSLKGFMDNSKKYKPKTLKIHSKQISQVSLDWRNGYLYSISSDAHFSVFSTKYGRLQSKTRVSNLALSCLVQHKDVLCLGSWDNSIYIYEKPLYGQIKQIQKIEAAHKDNVSCLDTTSSYLISGSWDAWIKTWSWRESTLATEPSQSFQMKDKYECKCVAANPKDTNCFAAGLEDGTIAVFDHRIKKPSFSLDAHEDEVSDLCWDPKKNQLVSCCLDGQLSLWDLLTRRCVMVGNTGESIISIKCDGDRVLSGGEMGSIKLWSLGKSGFENPECVFPLPEPDCVVTFDLSPDTSCLAVGTSESYSNLFLFST